MSAPNIGEAPLPQLARGYGKTWISARYEGLEKLLEAERTQLPPWFVVGFGSGIAAWFALGSATGWKAFLCVAAALSVAGFALAGGRAGRALGWFALAAMLGCGLVWARALWVSQPRLARTAIVELTARVIAVDHLAARESVRLLVHPDDAKLPPNIRVTIKEDQFPPGIAPGSTMRLRARLTSPPPMAIPAPTILPAMPGSGGLARSARRSARLA